MTGQYLNTFSLSLWEFLEEREERAWTVPQPVENYWDNNDDDAVCGATNT